MQLTTELGAVQRELASANEAKAMFRSQAQQALHTISQMREERLQNVAPPLPHIPAPRARRTRAHRCASASDALVASAGYSPAHIPPHAHSVCQRVRPLAFPTLRRHLNGRVRPDTADTTAQELEAAQLQALGHIEAGSLEAERQELAVLKAEMELLRRRAIEPQAVPGALGPPTNAASAAEARRSLGLSVPQRSAH